MDDLKLANNLIFAGQGMCLEDTGGGVSVFGTSKRVLDGSGIVVNQPNTWLTAASIYFSTGVNQIQVNVLQGHFSCTGCWFTNGSSGTIPAIQQTGGFLQINNSFFITNAGDHPEYLGNTAGQVSFVGNQFIKSSGITFTKIVLQIQSGMQGMVSNNMISTLSSGSGTFVQFDVDGFNRMIGNVGSGRTNSCPATQTNMRSGFNGAATNATCN